MELPPAFAVGIGSGWDANVAFTGVHDNGLFLDNCGLQLTHAKAW